MTMTSNPADWRSQGACLTADPDLFFPISSAAGSRPQERLAKQVCAGCPVREPCLRFALRTNQAHGVWGGLGENERLRLRRHLRAAHDGLIPQRVPGTGRVGRPRSPGEPAGQNRYQAAS
jgi:WhiB family transcriptional regulator, redox-sensing transcriptional regulator